MTLTGAGPVYVPSPEEELTNLRHDTFHEGLYGAYSAWHQPGEALQMTSNEAPPTEFPRSIGKVAARELARAGYTRFEHLTQVSKKSLLAIHGVGPKSLNILEQELEKRGLAYKRS